MSSRCWAPVVLLAFAAVLSAGTAAGADDSQLEYRVKAAFLYNFAKFVTWPVEKFASPQSPIEICVLEPDPFGDVLDDTVRGKEVEGRPLLVRRASRLDSLRSCHILYAEESGAGRADDLFRQLAPSSVMTVHSGARTLTGGIARFFIEDRRVRFEINAASAERAHLQLSARLQSVAVIVRN